MTPIIIGAATLYLGDCIETMRAMPDNSVDSIVCDPPYGLSKEPDMVEVLKHWLAGDDYQHKGSGFMGKSWDSFVPGPSVWREAMRVLKPGGHMLAFFGSRTYDLGTLAIRLAGFEIRDQMMWVYGSGFPKSMDVSKAIDKARVEDIEPVRMVCRAVRAAMDAAGLKSKDLAPHFDNCHPRLIDHWAARDTDSQPSLPTMPQWAVLRELLALGGTHDSEVARLNGRKGEAGDVYQNAEVIGEHTGQTPGFVGERFGVADNSIRARSDAARQWEGWSTALKPAHEPICVARKPLIGTVAANVLAYGTGALNIDGCRIESTDGQLAEKYASVQNAGARANSIFGKDDRDRAGSAPHSAGRWPANLIHDGSDEVVALFPDSNGSGAARNLKHGNRDGEGWGMADKPGELRDAGTGSAARFFYCAKASRADRNAGLVDPGPVHKHGVTLRQMENAVRDGVATGNTHPTVKPTDLMAYLCRLVTPPGGVVLDPFMGSGSTSKAAMREGFRFIGCELEPEYLAIAEARIRHEIAAVAAAADAAEAAAAPVPQLDLFSGVAA